MFKHRKQGEEVLDEDVPGIADLDDIVDSTLLDFKTSMTQEVSDLRSRREADEYVRDHAKEILDRISNASMAFSRSVLELKQRKNVLETRQTKERTSKCADAIKLLDINIRLLEDCYIQTFQIVDPESPRSMVHYYTQAEITDIANSTWTKPGDSGFSVLPEGLLSRLSDAYIKQFMPCDAVLEKCQKTPPNATPETVLKGICLGDYVGQPYEFLLSFSDFDIERPYDVAVNRFTDDSIMALAIYDALNSLKRMMDSSIKVSGVVPRAYNLFNTSMKYYAKMLPDVGYGPRFHTWAIDDGKDYDSWANGGAMRSGTIGAFFNKIEDVIRYAIVSSYATHSHLVGEQGAVCTAVCVWLANHGAAKHEIRDYLFSVADNIVFGPEDFKRCPEKIFDLSLTPEELLGISGEERGTVTLSGIRTLSESMINFLDASNVITSIGNAMKYPCDADTVAAITGGIAAAYYNDVPYMDDIINARMEDFIPYPTAFVMKRLAEL